MTEPSSTQGTAPEDFPIDTGGGDEAPVTGPVEPEPDPAEPGDDEQVEHRDTGDSDDQADDAGGPDQ